jgi:adenylate cyclase
MKHILVIDDNEMMCLLIERLAHHENVSATIVKNGYDAVRELGNGEKFDVIFLDLVLPNMSGWDILMSIRENPATKDTPVVIVSGCSLSNEEMTRLQGKVSAIIDKRTFKKAEFHKILNESL